jgi:hypothetical protein
MEKGMNKTVLVAVLAAAIAAPALAKNDKQQGAASLPPGLQKKVSRGGQLPPGWQKRLQKGRPLEAELYRQAEPVPEQLRLKLPVGEAGSIDIRLEGKIVRLERASREILDVFDIQ